MRLLEARLRWCLSDIKHVMLSRNIKFALISTFFLLGSYLFASTHNVSAQETCTSANIGVVCNITYSENYCCGDAVCNDRVVWHCFDVEGTPVCTPNVFDPQTESVPHTCAMKQECCAPPPPPTCTENFFCQDGHVWKQNTDCSTQFWNLCDPAYGCSNGACNPPPTTPPPTACTPNWTASSCGPISIQGVTCSAGERLHFDNNLCSSPASANYDCRPDSNCNAPPPPPPPPPPPSCNCTGYSDVACGGSVCSQSEMYQTRTCRDSNTGAVCDTESRCVASSACVVPPPTSTPNPSPSPSPTPSPTLSVALSGRVTSGDPWSAVSVSGFSPLNNVDLRGSVSGSATGSIRYRFDCTNNGTYEHDNTTSADPYSVADLCDYSSPGTYFARVRVDRQGVSDTDTLRITVSAPTVSVVLSGRILSGDSWSTSGVSGTEPVTGIDLRGSVSGSATGSIRYRFDCRNNGSWEHDITTSANPYAIADLCNYNSAGNYTALVRVDRQGVSDTDTLPITILEQPDFDFTNIQSELQFYTNSSRTTPQQTFEPGETIYGRIVTKNDGGPVNTSFNVGFYLEESTEPGCGQSATQQRTIGSLGSGGTNTWDFTEQAPDLLGNKLAYAFADMNCAIDESDEDNNTRSKTYLVDADTWFETLNGDVGSQGNIEVSETAPSGRYQSEYLIVGDNLEGNVKTDNWSLDNYTGSLIPAGGVYNYFAERFLADAQSSGTATCSIGGGAQNGFFYCNGDANFSSGSAPTGNAVWFIEGNLTVSSNLAFGANDSATFIVRGDIIIETDVERADGIYIAGRVFSNTTNSVDNLGPQLTIQGAVYGRTVTLPRKLGGNCGSTCNNATDPVERIIFDPKYLVGLNDVLGSASIAWREVAP